MEESIIVLMLKDPATGILEKEYGSYRLRDSGLLVNIYVNEKKDGFYARLKLSTPDVEDEEFDEVYDRYDDGIFAGEGVTVSETQDCFNPTWDFVYLLPENESAAQDKLQRIIDIHNREVAEIMELIRK